MKKDLLITILLFCLLQSLKAQDRLDVLIIDLKHDISISAVKFVKEINVQRGLFKKSKKSLLQLCIDSTQYYDGNCFKVTFFDDTESVSIIKGQGRPDYIRGEIYALDESEIQQISEQIIKYKPSEVNLKETYNSRFDSLMSKNFRVGLETGISGFPPKLSYIVFRNRYYANTYYGAEFTFWMMDGFFSIK